MLPCVFAIWSLPFSFFFFFNDTATTEIYTLSLHDALPILARGALRGPGQAILPVDQPLRGASRGDQLGRPRPLLPLRELSERSEEHTSELQSLAYLVCRLLLEKKKNHINDMLALHPAIVAS